MRIILLVTVLINLVSCNRFNNDFSSSSLECGENTEADYAVVYNADSQKLNAQDLEVLIRRGEASQILEQKPTREGCIAKSNVRDDDLILIKSPKLSQAQVIKGIEISGRSEIRLLPMPEDKPSIRCDHYLSNTKLQLGQFINLSDSKFLDFYDVSAEIKRDGALLDRISQRPVLDGGFHDVDHLIRGKVYDLEFRIHDHIVGNGEASKTTCELDMDIGELTAKLGDEIKEYRDYFGQEYGVVEEGYELNFYIEGGLKNVDIDYCVLPLEPAAEGELLEAGSCADLGLETQSYIQSEQSPKFNSGFWNIRYRYRKGLVQKDWTDQKIVVRKVCKASEMSVVEVQKNICTDIDGAILLEGREMFSGELNLPYISVVLGQINLFNSAVTHLNMPNLNLASQINLTENSFLKTIKVERLRKISLDLILFHNRHLEGMTGFRSLETIGGDFQVTFQYFNSFKGMEELKHIGGEFFLKWNDGIRNFEGLKKLVSVGKNLVLEDNYSIENLDHLDSLESIGGYLNLVSNEELTNFDSLEGVIIEGSRLVIDNKALSSLDGLRGTEMIRGGLSLVDLHAVKDLTALKSLKETTRLRIDNLKNLQNLSGLSNLSKVKSIELTNCDSLKDITDLTSISRSEELKIENNNTLLNLEGLQNITEISNHLFIGSNDNLLSFEGLESLKYVERLSIENNFKLIDTNSLTALESIGRGLSIVGNRKLSSFGARPLKQESLNYVAFRNNFELLDTDLLKNITDGKTWIFENNAFLDFRFISNIRHLSEGLKIRQSDHLASLNGLNNLETVGVFELLGSKKILNLNGLEKLTKVTDRLNISQMYGLETLQGLSSLKSVGESFEVRNNPKLTQLDVIGNLEAPPKKFDLVRNKSIDNACEKVRMYFKSSVECIDTINPVPKPTRNPDLGSGLGTTNSAFN